MNETEQVSAPEAGRTEAGSLLRGLALLDVLRNAQRPMSGAELAEATQQPPSTVHRLMQVLVSGEYAYRHGAKRYFASPKALVPLNLYHPLNVLRREAREHLRAMRDQFRQTASILLFLGTERLVLELAVENDSLSPYHATHLKSPLPGAATGKVLLASLSPAERAKLLGTGPLPRPTQNSIPDLAALDAELDVVRSRGFAVAIDENHIGLSAVAAPIHAAPGHVVGCFALAGLTSTFSRESVHAAGQVLKMTADLFSLGSSAVRAIAAFAGREAGERSWE
jgi:DNA-binding IclR family transcriptional regulator